ncbi:MAG: glutamate N-acetyltransferase / amino-acid N-acetyltransferase [Frankiaceae bacterium]|nr:glutamate N-acetyltransferase / amino-acid N-acetyltransferase [Frankiaceae bacterium]
MSVTAPKGFRAAGVTAGLKASGKPDVALVVSDTVANAAAVFTSNTVRAAPVRQSVDALADGRLRAVILNSGGANACTGVPGRADAAAMAVTTARQVGCEPEDVAVASTGLIGVRLPMDRVLPGIEAAAADLAHDGGPLAARAIMTTDSVPKESVRSVGGVTVGGMAKGAGMLAPALATMLVVLTTDAVIDSDDLATALRVATRTTFDRVDADGCMSTNDAVYVLANGASGVPLDPAAFTDLLTEVCADLASQLVDDAEGASKRIEVTVAQAVTEADALAAARAVARSSLLKCAVHGEDPNWGRVLAAIGTTAAAFDPDRVGVSINGVQVCRDGVAYGDLDLARTAMKTRDVAIDVTLNAGVATATVLTTDLTAAYVHENSAYST